MYFSPLAMCAAEGFLPLSFRYDISSFICLGKTVEIEVFLNTKYIHSVKD